jgi:glycosyltransferase involved in cell wall biosynthesis
MKKLISILTPTMNEEQNILELCSRIKAIMKGLEAKYDYEHIIIDNASEDDTVKNAKLLARENNAIKIIVNNRNYGPVRSHYYGIISCFGDAVIYMAADLQDPPELIPKLLNEWEEGYEVVLPIKPQSNESKLMQKIRHLYYRTLNLISETPLIENATGAGLFDKKVVDYLRKINDPYPYFRGLICELGFKSKTIEFLQPQRAHGKSKANIYILADQAFLGITKHSKLPLRIMTFLGLGLGLATFMLSILFLILKIIYWDSYNLGMAPLLIGIFFIASIQFFFLGIIGEYVGMVLTHVRNLPLVVEKERINF